MKTHNNALTERQILGKTFKETVKNRRSLEDIRVKLEGKSKKQWLSKKDASDYIGLSERQLDRYRSNNLIKAYQTVRNGRVRFKRVDLDNFLHGK